MCPERRQERTHEKASDIIAGSAPTCRSFPIATARYLQSGLKAAAATGDLKVMRWSATLRLMLD